MEAVPLHGAAGARSSPPDLEPVPPGAEPIFGSGLPLAVRYAELLAGRGRLVGVIGPREGARMWTRHVMNCAALAPLIDQGMTVADVGSGAGLPGIPLAIARPDLHLRLVESLARRVHFLREVVSELELTDRVEVVHARAESLGSGAADVVAVRAVADLPTLLTWCIPLVPRHGGVLLAMRGEQGAAEVASAAGALSAHRSVGELVELPGISGGPPIRVARVVRQ